MSKRDFYKVLLVGASGKGKTYSFRNMDREKTLFINVENKPLPFKPIFKHTIVPKTPLETLKAIAEGGKNPEISCILIDSFSGYLDLLMAEARINKTGYDVFTHYNTGIAKINDIIKQVEKEVFITAHYEIIADELTGKREKRVKCNGKQWEGMYEKDFTVVTYSECIQKEGGKVEYFYNLSNDGSNSAKMPPGIFPEGTHKIENDCNLLYQKILEFLKT